MLVASNIYHASLHLLLLISLLGESFAEYISGQQKGNFDINSKSRKQRDVGDIEHSASAHNYADVSSTKVSPGIP